MKRVTRRTQLFEASLFATSLALAACGEVDQTTCLQKVLGNLERIESAAYRSLRESYAPGDTIPSVHTCFFQELDNPADTTIGACYLCFTDEKTPRLQFGYDGNAKFSVEHDLREVRIDDFTARPLPFRPVNPPFFNRAENIVRYALTTSDRIETQFSESGDSYRFRMIIDIGKAVEFFGKAFYMPDPGIDIWGPPVSAYELWIRKSDCLPYRIRREQVHDTSVETVSDVEINRLTAADLRAADCYPADYTIVTRQKQGVPKRQKPSIVGKQAPDWTLTDAGGKAVSLGDFKGKVLLLNFTGIGCGHCYEAIPFLNGLKKRYAPGDFDLAAIETWGKSLHSLRVYSDRHELAYPMLAGNDEVIRAYLPDNAVPVFILLDKQRVVRSVHTGYGKGTSDKEITEAIEKLLQKH